MRREIKLFEVCGVCVCVCACMHACVYVCVQLPFSYISFGQSRRAAEMKEKIIAYFEALLQQQEEVGCMCVCMQNISVTSQTHNACGAHSW